MNRLLRLLSSLGIMLTLLAALSLAAAGGAHRIAASDAAQEVLAQVFGQDAQICGEVGGKSGLSEECPVCHLVGAVVLPDATQSAKAVELRFVAAVVLPRAQRAADTPLDPAHGTRAPPSV